MPVPLQQILSTRTSFIAVVGATDSHYKYGSVIYRNLKQKGYRVLAVNPSRTEVHGDPCYASVSDLPVSPDMINFVTQPEVTLRVLEECIKNRFMFVWIQPGASNEAVLKFLRAHPFVWTADECIMMHAR